MRPAAEGWCLAEPSPVSLALAPLMTRMATSPAKWWPALLPAVRAMPPFAQVCTLFSTFERIHPHPSALSHQSLQQHSGTGRPDTVCACTTDVSCVLENSHHDTKSHVTDRNSVNASRLMTPQQYHCLLPAAVCPGHLREVCCLCVCSLSCLRGADIDSQCAAD